MRTTWCLLALIALTSGCGSINRLRGHNVAMTIDAIQSIPRTGGTTITIERCKADALDRLALLQRDWPAPDKPVIERGSVEDDQLYNAYAGKVASREARRRIREILLKPIKTTWDYFTFLVKWGWLIALISVIVWIRREFFRRDIVHVKHIQATLPDKEVRRKLAERSPIGQAYDKIEHLLVPSGNGCKEKTDIEAR